MRRRMAWLLLSAALLVSVFASLSVGPSGFRVPPPFGGVDLVMRLRLYRTVAAVAVGALLGLAGSLIQYVASNPLAGPSLLGLPQGGLVAVAAAMLASGQLLPPGLGLLVGAVGALAAYWATVVVAGAAGMSGVGLVVAGVAVSSAASGLAALLLYLVEARLGIASPLLLIGTYAYATRGDALVAAASAAVLTALGLPLVRGLDALSYGDEVAAGLGYSPRLVRLVATFIAALAVAASIYVAGVVAFIGLIAPNVARRLLGGHPSAGLPGGILVGALLSVAADTWARLAAPLLGLAELPAGTATSILGGVFLAYLVAARRGVEA